MTIAVPSVDFKTVETRFGTKTLRAIILVKRLESLNRAFVGVIWESMGTVPVALAREYSDLLSIAVQRASDIILELREDGYQVTDNEKQFDANP